VETDVGIYCGKFCSEFTFGTQNPVALNCNVGPHPVIVQDVSSQNPPCIYGVHFSHKDDFSSTMQSNL